jgi:dTDP-4-dehydrorhamnose reductase
MVAETCLVLGAAGQVGQALHQRLLQAGQSVVALTRQDLDLRDFAAVRQTVLAIKPRWIFNAAAYTAVDQAEQEPAQAFALNATLPAVLAEGALSLDAGLVHFSSDYVFNGQSQRPYLETDPTDPLSVYGQSKRDGDLAVLASRARHWVFRSSWVMAAHGQNFLKTMLRLACERDRLQVVADQQGVPTPADWLADMVWQAVKRGHVQGWGGLYHLTPLGQTSWHGYARLILTQAEAKGWPLKVAPDQVQAIATADYPLPAVRPAYSLLDNGRLMGLLGLTWPNWQDGVTRVVTQLTAPQAPTTH